ncbi:MAG TPA: ABC transporter permease [Anaerolineales bacterium]|nr:ABC transporter permease [Anaerolineales bacterium]
MAIEAKRTPRRVLPGMDEQGITEREASFLERAFGPENARIVRGLFTNTLSIVGFALIGLFVMISLLAPVLAPPLNPNKPYDIPRDGFSSEPKPPMTEWKRNAPDVPFWYKPIVGQDRWVHLMGTASGQYDVYYGVIWGARTAFVVGIIIVGASVLIGVSIGSVAAYYGRRVDDILMRITEVFMSFPYLMAALTLSAILVPRLGRGIYSAMVALTAFGWMSYARLIRGDILSVKERDYVMAARVIGAHDRRILLRHILPNAIFPTMVYASLDLGSIVLSFAALSFIGVGTEVGYADWGQILSFARAWIPNLTTYWYIVVYPGVALVLFVLSWNLVGDALRDVLDPSMRGRSGG